MLCTWFIFISLYKINSAAPIAPDSQFFYLEATTNWPAHQRGVHLNKPDAIVDDANAPDNKMNDAFLERLMEKIRKDDTGDWFEMNRPQKSPRRRKFSVQKYKDEDEQEANDGDSDDGKDFYVQEEKRLGGRTSPLDLEHLIAQHEARMQYINQLDHNHKAMNNIG